MTAVTGVDYPDLTAARASSLQELTERAQADMADILGASRSAPVAASPAAGSEPGSGRLVLQRRPAVHSNVSTDVLPTPAFGIAGRSPYELGVGELLSAYASGALTPTAVLASLRPRWGASGPAPDAIVSTIAGTEEAFAESDRRWAAGSARPLEGIPFAVKDIIDVAGARVTCGSLVTGDRIAPSDSVVVARLRSVGAVPVFMSATTEFACGAPHNARYGPVANPWDATRWTGGSSTGSAAALAARLVPLALGTDTGGSIRVPSALCNLTGIKPTYGLVPRTGVASLSWTLDHVGPMARSAADLALVLPHVSGPDGVDPEALPERAVTTALSGGLTSSLTDARIGRAGGWFTELCDRGVLAAFDGAVSVFENAGVSMPEVGVGDVHRMHDDVTVLLTCELASNQEQNAEKFAMFDTGTQVRIARGTVPSAVDYLRSVRRRAAAQQRALSLWDDAGIDFLLTPGIGATAARLSDVTVSIDGVRLPMQSVIGRNTSVFDYLGFPAVMLPAGTLDGLPVGVQLVGRPGTDMLCLDVAQRFQAITSHHLRVPVGCGGD
nr:amidase [Rhodococcus sp. (in: high G+C Gram-positive bacteria)]